MFGWARLGTWIAIAAVLVAGLFGGFLGLRARLEPSQSIWLDSWLLGALIAAIAAALAIWAVQQHYRGLLNELREYVVSLRKTASLATRQPIPEELAAVCAELEALGQDYRQVLADRVKQHELLAEIRSGQADLEPLGPTPLGRAGADRGSLLTARLAGGGEQNLVARLAPNLHWLGAAPALQKYLGQTIPELLGRSFLDFVNREDVAGLTAALQEALTAGEGHNITFRVLPRGRGERHVQLDVVTRYSEDAEPLHLRCLFLDVTDRVRTDQELRRRTDELSLANERLQQINADLATLKESYRDLYHNAPVMYFSLDADGRFAAWNQTLTRLLGYVRDDLYDQPYARLLGPEAARAWENGAGTPAAYQQAGEIETQWVKKDGTVIDVSIRNEPVLDPHGRFQRTRSAALDVTERNLLADALRTQAEELERANAELRRINRELDDFTHVVSHDLKEPLRTLQGFGNFLAQDYGDTLGDRGKEYLNHLIQAGQRLGTLIDDLLMLSRAGRIIHTVEIFDLNHTVRSVCGDLADLIQRKGASVRGAGALPAVAGDPDRLSQLLANLITNGLKYNHSAKPEIVIGQAREPGVRSQESGVRGQDSCLPTPDSACVTLFVRDNGIGIEPRFHEQIFRIFRRLHRREEYEGTGAGLAICKKIIEAHGGRIWVESQPGQGATFYFTLPRPQAPRNLQADAIPNLETARPRSGALDSTVT